MVRCPKCGVEIDVDEDEIEEGEILSCGECEAELEVVQTHPVRVNVISEDDEESEEGEEEDEEGDLESDDGDLQEGGFEDEEDDAE